MSRIVAPHPHIVHQARPVSWIRHRAGERRLDDESARLLARQVFFKYDTNRSGFMNSQEAAHMVSDLYLSINEHQPTSQQDGLDFMVANDINNDHNMSLADFEDIFVRHLSTHDQTGYSLTSPHVTAFAEERSTPGRVVHPYPAPVQHQPVQVSRPVVQQPQRPVQQQGYPQQQRGYPQQQPQRPVQQQQGGYPQQQRPVQQSGLQPPQQGQYVQSEYPAGQR